MDGLRRSLPADLSRRLGPTVAPVITLPDDSVGDLLFREILLQMGYGTGAPPTLADERYVASEEGFFRPPRYPYFSRTYVLPNGVIRINRDGITLQIEAFLGHPGPHGAGEEMATFVLRDCRLDGRSPDSEESVYDYPLVNWFYHNATDQLLADSLEFIATIRDPSKCVTGDSGFRTFLKDPYRILTGNWRHVKRHRLEDEQAFLRYWPRAFSEGEVYPGQDAPSMPGALEYFVNGSARLLARLGYQWLAAIPSYFHVAKLLEYYGGEYRSDSDRHQVDELDLWLADIRRQISGRGRDRIDAKRGSWLVVLQFLQDKELIPEGLLAPCEYPLSPERNLWMQFSLRKRLLVRRPRGGVDS